MRYINPADNRLCTDCHVIETHKGKDCLECHGLHNTGNLYNVRGKIKTNGLSKDVEFKTLTTMSGKKGVCVICHTITFYHNTTLAAPTHHDRQDCAECHPHSQGFPAYTTVLNIFVGKLLAFVGFKEAYADEPPPLENYSMGGDGLLSFEAEATVQTEGSQASGQTVTSDVTYYYHNDHLGTPLFMSDEAGSIVWRREQEPFGTTTFERGTASEQLRFPGQYYDAETGLAQNWHRDYSAILGRYVEADPVYNPDFAQQKGCGNVKVRSIYIGPYTNPAELNLYVYSVNGPLTHTDRKGLFSVSNCGCEKGNIETSVKTACMALAYNTTMDISYKRCIIDRCNSGRIECTDQGLCGNGNTYGFASNRIPTVYFCNGRLKSQNVNYGQLAVHEWAHTCGWKDGEGGNGIPYESGYID